MKKLNILIALSIVALSLSGCKKILVTQDNKAKLLTGKNWKITAYTEDGIDKLNTTYGPCDLDNIQNFAQGGTYTVDEGATKCFDDDPQIYEKGKWELKDGNLIFSEDGVGLQLQFKVVEIGKSTMKLSMKNPFGEEELLYTYTAQ